VTPSGNAKRLRSLARRLRPRPAPLPPAAHPDGRTAFVVGGSWPLGGTRIALNLGELLRDRFGFEIALVQGRQEAQPGLIPVADVRRIATPDDIVICNPSFSDHQFGLSCRAPVLMYIQSVNAYRGIDGFCDLYVSSSTFVRDHVQLHYGLTTKVISPFVDFSELPPTRPFLERDAGRALVYSKLYGEYLVPALRDRLSARNVGVELIEQKWLSHREFLAAIAEHRFAVCLAPLEGFGLVPLEALAVGTVPIGFHGGGGRDYLDETVGAGMTQYPDLDGVADRMARLARDDAAALAISRAGPDIAAPFNRETFDRQWTDELERLVDRKRGA
jgi:Glycosyl transferases group 1